MTAVYIFAGWFLFAAITAPVVGAYLKRRTPTDVPTARNGEPS